MNGWWLRLIAIGGLLGLACGQCSAAAPWVVPVDGAPFPAELVSVDKNGEFAFRTIGQNDEVLTTANLRTFSADDLVRWSHPKPPRPQPIVLLADGSRLVAAADWSGGAAVRTEGDSLVVLSDFWDEVRLPRSRVRGLVFAIRRRPPDRQRLEDQIRASAGNQDTVLLTNRDRLHGEVVQIDGGTLTLTTDVGDAKLPLSRIESVTFAAGGNRANHNALMIVGLRDGSLLYVDELLADETRLVAKLAGDIQLAGSNVEEIASLQLLRGTLTYLSDLEPADYRHVPYLNIPWPFQRDRNALGDSLTVDGLRYVKGIGMHSAARLTHRLDDQYRRFDVEIALDDSTNHRGSVIFRVYLLRGSQWQAAYASDVVRGGERPQPVSIDVEGAQAMTLIVDYADRGDELDHADWLDARLVK